MRRPERPTLNSMDDEELAFSEEEIRFIDSGTEVDVTMTNLESIAIKITDDVYSGRWDSVEKALANLLCTRILPGFFKVVAGSGIGTVVAYIFRREATEDNFLAVRMATLLVGYWESGFEHVQEQRAKKRVHVDVSRQESKKRKGV